MNKLASFVTSNTPHEARFTTEQYRLISESGALDGFAKTELHDGRIIVVNAQHVPHGRIKTEIAFALNDSLRALASPLSVLIETDVDFEDGQVFQPDITIWQATPERHGIPRGQVRIAIEVADSSKAIDLGWKRSRFAAGGIPEYWVVVLETEHFERFAAPVAGEYTRHDHFPFAVGCQSLTFPGIGVPAGVIRR